MATQKNIGAALKFNLKSEKMDTTNIGQQAEQNAAKYLKTKGYKIIDYNWRTKLCEIDVIAQKQNTIYFVEVNIENPMIGVTV